VLVIGLDGATPNLLFRLVRQGYLKNLQKMMATGSYGKLMSTIPPATCPAWVSSVTGVNPGKHGIHDFFLSLDIKKRNFDFANSTKRKTKAIWNILSDAGKETVILNVPVTYPPEKVNGVMVSGVLTPSLHSNFTYPKKAKDDLLNLGYQVDLGETMLEKTLAFEENKTKMLYALERLIEKRLVAAEFFMKRYDWNFFMVVFVALDRIQHFFWRYIDSEHAAYEAQEAQYFFPHILKVFKKLDDSIGRLVTGAGEDVNTLIYSDHGFKSLNTFFFTNNLLRKKKLLRIRKKSASSVISQDFIIKKIVDFGLDNLVRKVPTGLKRRTGMFLRPSKGVIDIFDLSIESKTFQFGNGFIKINRETVSTPEEYEKVRDEIIRLFNEELVHGTLFRAYKKDEAYHGKHIKNIPDIILVSRKDALSSQLIPTNGLQFMDYDEKTRIPSLMWNGQHDQYGIIICSGPNLKRGYDIKNANILDITPTILKILREPIPDYMDGKILDCVNKYDSSTSGVN